MSGGKAILIVWTDIPAEEEDAFNEWYNREHVRSRVVDLPGFTKGRRFVAITGGPKYVALYDVEDISVFRSEPYLALVARPDAKSQHFIPKFHNVIRMASDVTASAGDAEGGILGLQALAPIEGCEDRLLAGVSDHLIPALVARPGIIAAHLWNVNAAILEESVSRHLRSGDRVFEWLLAIEGASQEEVIVGHDELMDDATLDQHGIVLTSDFAVCRLTYRVEGKKE